MKFPLVIGKLVEKRNWYLVNAIGNMAIKYHYFLPPQSAILKVEDEKYCTLARQPRCRYFYWLVISYNCLRKMSER